MLTNELTEGFSIKLDKTQFPVVNFVSYRIMRYQIDSRRLRMNDRQAPTSSATLAPNAGARKTAPKNFDPTEWNWPIVTFLTEPILRSVSESRVV